MLVLHDLMVVERNTDYKSSDEGGICDNSVCPRDVFSIELRHVSLRDAMA